MIKLDRKIEAKRALDQAKISGIKAENFAQLEKKLANQKKDLNIIFSIEKIYKNSKSIILSKAVQGWFFTTSFDNYFIEKKLLSSDINIRKFPLKKDIVHIPIVNNEHSFNVRQTIDYLNKEADIVEKFNKLSPAPAT